MSEYQYYEFQALDRPLTRDEQAYLRALSTRARITPTSFTNEYNWGDFKGDPRKLVARYFDARTCLASCKQPRAAGAVGWCSGGGSGTGEERRW